jgi:gentisate 1,2-dioxygenase
MIIAAASWPSKEGVMIGEQKPTETVGSTRPVAQVGHDPELLAFSGEAHRHALMPGWEFQSAMPNEPIPLERAYRWSWTEALRPMMVKAYDVVDPITAERRNLILANPGLKGAATTQTLIAAVQGVLPGEIAPAHRHTAGALRFMIEGHGSFTNVNGEPCYMDPASLILTPQWSWHDHANETDHPVIWLDVLDVPFIMAINQWFWEPFPDEIQPRSRPRGENLRRFGAGIVRPVGPRVHDGPSPLLVYPWDRTETTLCELAELDEGDGDVTVEYNNPLTGGPVLPTIGCYAHMLRPGALTRPRRTNASAVLHVVRGRGCTTVGDQKLEWETGDCLAIPHWTWVHHENRSATEPAFLFSSTDAPILEAFGIHREEVSGGHGR